MANFFFCRARERGLHTYLGGLYIGSREGGDCDE